MAEYSDSIPEVDRPEAKPTPEQKSLEAEKALADPAFYVYAKAVAERDREDIGFLLDDEKSEDRIIEMSREYHENVVPVVERFKGFFKNEFFGKFKGVKKDKLDEAAKSAETFLARQAAMDPEKFATYNDLFDTYETTGALAAQLERDIQRDYRTSAANEIEAQKQQMEEMVRQGESAELTNAATLKTALSDIKKRKWYNGAIGDTLSRLKNRAMFWRKEGRSDSEIREQILYNEAKDSLADKIKNLKDGIQLLDSRVDARAHYQEEVNSLREQLLDSLEKAGDVRSIFMEGLKEAIETGTYKTENIGEAQGAVNEIWDDESENDDEAEYRAFRMTVMENLKMIYDKAIADQIEVAKKGVNLAKIQEFVSFIDKSVTDEATQKLAEEVLQKKLDDEIVSDTNSTKVAHLTLMMKRLRAKTF